MRENFFIYRKKDKKILFPILTDSKYLERVKSFMNTEGGYDGYAVGTVFIKGKKIFDTEPRGFATSELDKLILKKINYKAK